MKKLITVIFAIAMIATLCVSAFAATGINEHEQAVLDKLSTTKVIGANGWTFSIPQEYINSAKNYFLNDCDMTEAEKTAIIGYIDSGMAIVKQEADAQQFAGTEYKLSLMSQSARSQVLALGQKACAEVDLNLVYNSSTNKVIITPVGSTTPIFENTPVVKTTGQDFTLTTAMVVTAVAVVMVVCTAGLFVFSKKKGLLVK